ncbi:hypothetical protein, partial [Citrobacter freundii]|uniref:hypothetical protein n=1 Tax=Citrobacter freundii TaxID=546 RepID=UPI001C432B04
PFWPLTRLARSGALLRPKRPFWGVFLGRFFCSKYLDNEAKSKKMPGRKMKPLECPTLSNHALLFPQLFV